MNKIGLTDLYRDGKHYDALNNFDYDIPFYFDLIKLFGEPILDLGCGTGRITIPIAKNGHKIIGIDSSKKMLDEAMQKAQSSSLTIDFIESDIRNFDLPERFSLILLTFNTICHLYDFESIFSTFTCIKKHLKPGGRLIIDVFNPDLSFLSRDENIKSKRATYKNPYNAGNVEITQSNFYSKKEQTNYNKWFFKMDGKEFEQELNKRVFFPQEIDNYIRFLNMEIENKYGDFQRSPFADNSSKQIIVCKLVSEK
jgi:SAM-dependent methyltransferase